VGRREQGRAHRGQRQVRADFLNTLGHWTLCTEKKFRLKALAKLREQLGVSFAEIVSGVGRESDCLAHGTEIEMHVLASALEHEGIPAMVIRRE
jgi:hypothetical protein